MTVAEAQPPLRIGGSFSGSGTYAELGQTVHRGNQLCVKHASDKGGVLGRRLEHLAENDASDSARTVAIYQRLLAQEKVDAVLSPFSASITDAVVAVTERQRKPLVGCGIAATSNDRKRRKFIFMCLTPGEMYFEGLVDMAVKRGLKTIAVLHEDTPFPTAIAQGGLSSAISFAASSSVTSGERSPGR